VEQSLRFYEALVKAGVPSEFHVFSNEPMAAPRQKRSVARPVAGTARKLAARAGVVDGGQKQF